MRRAGVLIRDLVAVAAACALCAPAALADSEVPPVDSTGRTFALILVGVGVLVVVLLSATALRGLFRSRSARWSEREYEARQGRRRATGTSAPAEGAEVTGEAGHPETP